MRKDDRSTFKAKVETTKKKEDIVVVNKGRPKTQQHNRDIKCFNCHGICHISIHCPNKRTVVMHSREIMTDSTEEEEQPMPHLIQVTLIWGFRWKKSHRYDVF